MKKNTDDVFFSWLKAQVFGEPPTAFNPDWQAFEKHRNKKLFFFRIKVATGLLLLMILAGFLGNSYLWNKKAAQVPEIQVVSNPEQSLSAEGQIDISPKAEVPKSENVSFGVQASSNQRMQGNDLVTTKIATNIPAKKPLSRRSNTQSMASEITSSAISVANRSVKGETPLVANPTLEPAQEAPKPISESKFEGGNTDSSIIAMPAMDADYISSKSPEGANAVSQEIQLASLIPEDPKWAFQLSIYPSFTFRELGINPGSVESVHKDYQSITNTSEKAGFAVNAGLDISYNFKRDLFITTGFYYIQHKIGGRYNFSNDLRPIVQDGIIQDYEQGIPVTVDRNIFNTYHYINIPVLLSYQPWASKKIRIKMEGGISTLIFAGAEGITLDPQSLAIRESGDLDYRSLLFSLNIRIGAAYLINKNVMFGLEPSLLYFNNSIYRDPNHPVYMVPYAVGLNANLRILLN